MKSNKKRATRTATRSLPSWERGLKSYFISINRPQYASLPSWERGLKFKAEGVRDATNIVAPFVGAWIEMVFEFEKSECKVSRSLRGSVD